MHTHMHTLSLPLLCLSVSLPTPLCLQLIKFLTAFHNDRAEDEQFSEEKQYLINQIKELK